MKRKSLFLLILLAGAVAVCGGCNDDSSDNDPPAVSLSLANSSMAEADGTLTVTAILSEVSSARPVTVQLSFSGTATLKDDYTQTGTRISIPAGATQGMITLSAVPDTLDENDETIIVDIDTVTNGIENGIQQVIASIIDDDLPPVAIALSGTVAAGVPLATAVVSAVNVLGQSAGPVNANTDGTYTLFVNEGAPYMLKAYSANSDTTLFSYAGDSSLANITPLTNLALFTAAGLEGELADRYANWKDNPIPESDVRAATRMVNANLAALYRSQHVDADTYNFFETPFPADGHGIDGVLDNLNIAIDPEAPTMESMIRMNDAEANSIIFDPFVDISDFFLIDRISPAAAYEKLSTGKALLTCSYSDATCGKILIENALLKSELEQQMSSLSKSQELIFY